MEVQYYANETVYSLFLLPFENEAKQSKKEQILKKKKSKKAETQVAFSCFCPIVMEYLAL